MRCNPNSVKTAAACGLGALAYWPGRVGGAHGVAGFARIDDNGRLTLSIDNITGTPVYSLSLTPQ